MVRTSQSMQKQTLSVHLSLLTARISLQERYEVDSEIRRFHELHAALVMLSDLDEPMSLTL